MPVNSSQTSVPTAVPRVPLTSAALRLHGRWWWFCDESVMKDAQPVFLSEMDKYDVESDCCFEHPWASQSARLRNDLDLVRLGNPWLRFVRNWADCFHGPCLTAPQSGFVLNG